MHTVKNGVFLLHPPQSVWKHPHPQGHTQNTPECYSKSLSVLMQKAETFVGCFYLFIAICLNEHLSLYKMNTLLMGNHDACLM